MNEENWSGRAARELRKLTAEDDEIMVEVVGPRGYRGYILGGMFDSGKMDDLMAWQHARRALAADGAFIRRFIEEYNGWMGGMSDKTFWRKVWGDRSEDVSKLPGKLPHEAPYMFDRDGLYIASAPAEISGGLGKPRKVAGWAVFGVDSTPDTREEPGTDEEVMVAGPFVSLRQAFVWQFHYLETIDINRRIEGVVESVDAEIDAKEQDKWRVSGELR